MQVGIVEHRDEEYQCLRIRIDAQGVLNVLHGEIQVILVDGDSCEDGTDDLRDPGTAKSGVVENSLSQIVNMFSVKAPTFFFAMMPRASRTDA